MRRRTALLGGLAAGAAVGVGLGVAASRRRAAHPPWEVLEGEAAELEVSDGAVLTLDVTGPEDGPLVVLAHCWGGHPANWSAVTRRLVDDGHRVVRWYQRGHGPSTTGEEGYAIERFGADLAEVLEAVDARDAVVAGHSLGGMTAQSFAIHHPDVAQERVRAFVLVGTSAGALTTSPLARAERLLRSPVVDRAMASRYGHLLVRGVLGAGASPDAVRLSRDHFVGTPLEVRLGIVDALLAMDLREGGRSITHPTTIIAGTRDALTPLAHSKAMADAIPSSHLVVLPRAGHMLPFERPEHVADHIAEAAR